MKNYVLITVMMLGFAPAAQSFTVNISGDGGELGQEVQSGDCKIGDESAFTGLAGNTVYSQEYAYSGNRSLKTTVDKGSTGFGTFGGAIEFDKCDHVGGRNLRQGDEIWVRARVFFPNGFEFNSGRNKFFRLRSYNTVNGEKVSEGYNDLYINGQTGTENYSPYWFIFEGAQQWFRVGDIDDFFGFGRWRTIEFYLRLDHKRQSEGGLAKVRVWVDGILIGDTGERTTLKTATSYISYFSLFTWFGNEGAPNTQSVYIDDLVITTDRPLTTDSNGNWYIGMGDAQDSSIPQPPTGISIK